MDVDQKYRDSIAKSSGGHETDNNRLPPYIIKGTPEEAYWRASHPNGQKSKSRVPFPTGLTPAHKTAQGGDIETLKKELESKKDLVNAKDTNGWQPISVFILEGHCTFLHVANKTLPTNILILIYPSVISQWLVSLFDLIYSRRCKRRSHRGCQILG